MNIRLVHSLLAITLLLALGAAVAEHPGRHAGGLHGIGNPERMVEHMARRLDMDENQTQVLRNIVTATAPAMREQREAIRSNREAIAALDVSDPDYAAKLDNLAAESGRLAADMTRAHGRLRAEIFTALTPVQRESLEQEIATMRDSGRGRRWHKDER